MLSTLLLLTFSADPRPVATSPDGRIQIEMSFAKDDTAPQLAISMNGRTLLECPTVGFRLKEGELGKSSQITSVTSRVMKDVFTQVTGKRRDVRLESNEVTIRFRERTEPNRQWDLVLRAFDDGVAFRYRFPKQAKGDEITIRQERTAFRIPAEAKLTTLPLNGFTTSYEKQYQTLPARKVPNDWLLGLPLLAEYSEGIFAAITEANVREFAGLYLAPGADGIYSARLSPWPGQPQEAVRHAFPHDSPWRVVLLGDRIGRLVESDLVLALNEPCAIADPSWIKTGKTTFPWWNGFYEQPGLIKPDLNTETAKYYIDFCAKAGIPYHSLDGVRNVAWYGGTIVPYEGNSPTKGLDGLDLQAVLRYAKSKNVRIRLWMHWQAAQKHMEKAFPLYREWGIEGIMLDFMDRDDQEMNRFVREAVALAAANHLTITLHGCPKPTGLERTYPNLLTHEGVMNLEYDKWDKIGITADHELTVPFTRMLGGPLDFHQGSFRTVPTEQFAPRNEAPLIRGTPSRTLASYVVFQNHLSMIADYPSAYRDHPALPVLVAIPTTWDDTKVLHAKVGEMAVIARRSQTSWHVGAMTDAKARSLKIPLRFLGTGSFRVQSCTDRAAAKYGLMQGEKTVTSADDFQIDLSAGGGAYLKIEPVKP